MSAALHIADNYNDVVDVITSLTAIYERTISVEPTLQQATHKQNKHKQLASRLYHSLLPMLYGCNVIELSDLQDHYNNVIRTISRSFAVDLEYPQPHRLFDPTP
jgi:ribosome-binding ATPase YchF (GTP1/OBG family)